ncbi:hypothetical protein ACH439_28020 [Streptomyces microflavus]|uniref:hypothetical protein n=1 Tax=Streptomyces microflavus TaxID=1919 RepID=UPI00379BFD57
MAARTTVTPRPRLLLLAFQRRRSESCGGSLCIFDRTSHELGEIKIILRTYIECPACESPILLRVGLSRDRQIIVVACPDCHSTIRGSIIPSEEKMLPRFDLPGIKRLDHQTPGKEWRVVNTYGDFPSSSKGEYSSFLSASRVFGEKFPFYLRCVSLVRSFAEKVDPLEHAYGFYLQERWDLLDSMMMRNFKEDWPIEGSWPSNPSDLDRHTHIHRILSLLAAAMDPGGHKQRAKYELWSRTFEKQEEFSELSFRIISEPTFATVNRRISDQFFRMLRDASEWIPALAIAHLRANGGHIPGDWRVPLGRIDSLRDAYRQNFEVSCQMLPLVIRIQNMSEGRDDATIRDPTLPDGWAPRALRPQDLVNNLNQFTKSNAATKEAYLSRYSHLRYFWNAAFSRDVRNSIAHAEFDYITHESIVKYKGREVPYYVFIEALIKQISLLIFWLDLCKLCKIYGSRWDPIGSKFLGLH